MDSLDGHSAIVMLTFILIIILVIRPIQIRLPQNRMISKLLLDFSTVPLLAIGFLLITRSIGWDQVKEGIIGTTMKPYGIVILVFALSYISISLDLTGIFTAMAMFAAQKSQGSGKKLFLNLYLLNAFVTIFASNDVVVLTLTPIVIYFTKTLELNPLPFLIAGFHAANTASTVLLIGNPTNIIVGETFQLGFFTYSAWMLLPTLGASICSFTVLYYLFHREIPNVIAVPNTLPNPLDSIKNKKEAYFCSIVMLLCLISLAIGSIWQYPVWIITVFYSGIMILRDLFLDLYNLSIYKKPERNPTIIMVSVPQESQEELVEPDQEIIDIESEQYQKQALFPHLEPVISRMPWKIIPFVFGMFIMVEALFKTGWVSILAFALSSLSQTIFGAVISMAFVSSFACVLINNQPMSILFSKALSHPLFSVPEQARKGSYLALILGSNLGGNLMIQAALAGFMWTHVLQGKNVNVSWSTFAYYGFLGMIPTLLISSVLLGIEASLIK